jgi:hypothetical protein
MSLTYYKVNVPYPVGIRWNVRDNLGRVLTINDPYVAIRDEEIRDFKRANKHAINGGLIILTEEPSLDEDTPNMIDDEKAAALVKNELALKQALSEITSVSIVVKLLDEAKTQERPSKIIKLIEKKLSEYEPEAPTEMRGVDSD